MSRLSVELKKYVRADKTKEASFRKADKIANSLLSHLNTDRSLKALSIANAPGTSSSLVQACFLAYATQLGFRDEATNLFATYETSALRPDYYLPLGKTGILLEVERGKTTINNMDFLDFWKCHLCEHANYLFLLVPKELRQNKLMSPRREYNAVSKRMSSFFIPRNYTNVYGLWLFGY